MKRIPFNWRNPYGYFIAVVFQTIGISYVCHYLACFMSFTLGAYLYAATINRYMIDDLKSMNGIAKLKKSNSGILNQLFNFIRAHSECKQLSKYSNSYDLNNSFILALLFFWELVWVYKITNSNNFKSILFRLITDLEEILETTLTIDFLSCTVALSITMLMVQMEVV